jgi:hypothetical protein
VEWPKEKALNSSPQYGKKKKTKIKTKPKTKQANKTDKGVGWSYNLSFLPGESVCS